MQREIGNEVHIGSTVSLHGSIRKSSVIDRTASNYEDSREKVKKKITGMYNADIAKYNPGTSTPSIGE